MSYDFIVGAGHTPSGTAGCGAVGTLDESVCTRQIAPLVANGLNSSGKTAKYIVVDEGNPGARFDDCYNRIAQANEDNCGMYVEIHLNAGGGTGVEVLVPSSADSFVRGVASTLCSKISEAFGYPNRGVKEQKLIIFSNATVPVLLIECGFVDSSDASIYDAQKYANAIVSALTGTDVHGGTDSGSVAGDNVSNEWKLGWNQDAFGWWYCTDVANKKYFKASDGWQYIKDAWYMFDVKGYALQETWFQDSDNNWYFLDKDCKMIHKTWLFICDSSLWYYMDDSGKMLYDQWITYKNNSYFLNKKGDMGTKEWIQYLNKWYYLNEDGKMAVSQWIDHNNNKYYVDSNGVMIYGRTITIDGKDYTFADDGILTSDPPPNPDENKKS